MSFNLDTYKVICLDCGGVLHYTSYKQNKSKVIQEMKDLEPLLKNLSNKYILVLVCNSTKRKMVEMILCSGIGRYFEKMYIGKQKETKIPRLEKVMRDYQTEKIILLDDKPININEATQNTIPAMMMTYSELITLRF